MDEHFSNLEVARHDPHSQAPELVSDREALAPERDLSANSPELSEKHWQNILDGPRDPLSVRPTNEKKNSYDAARAPETGTTVDGNFRRGSDDLPETGALGGSFPRDAADDEGLKEAAPGYQSSGITGGQGMSRRLRGLLVWSLVAFGLLILLVIALGVGLGVGLKRKKGSTASSTNTEAPIQPEFPPHGLQNDTSLATVSLPTGDRRLFFQETSGVIREALFTNSTQQWAADTSWRQKADHESPEGIIVATNAKNSTPIVSLLVNGTGTAPSIGSTIYLFYIANNNQLASRIFVSGTWTTRDNFSPSSQGNATYAAAPGSRALAVTANTNSAVTGEAFVFYLAQNGTVECLSILPDSSDGIVAVPGSVLPQSIQGDHVLALAAGDSSYGGKPTPQVGVLLSNGTTFYNLYFSFFTYGSWSKPELETILVPPLPLAYQPTLPNSLTLADAYPVTTTAMASSIPTPTSQSAAYNETLIGDVNIAQIFVPTPGLSSNTNEYTLFGFWVNGTELAAYTTKNIGLSGEPGSQFPFSRLAGTNVDGEVFLYHQINGTSIAQDVYNADGGFFTTSFFQVDT